MIQIGRKEEEQWEETQSLIIACSVINAKFEKKKEKQIAQNKE